jgi:hypothetical protein
VADRPSLVAALAGGGAAVLAAELGAGPLSVSIGALTGIAAGTAAEALAGRRSAARPA